MIRIEFEKEIADILEGIISKREKIYYGFNHIVSDYDMVSYEVYRGELEGYNSVIFQRISPHKPSRVFNVTFKKECLTKKEVTFVEENLSPAEMKEFLVNLIYKIDSVIKEYYEYDKRKTMKEKKEQRKKAIKFVKSLLH